MRNILSPNAFIDLAYGNWRGNGGSIALLQATTVATVNDINQDLAEKFLIEHTSQKDR